ncbi:Rieske (2Fe-2S) protein [Nonomuraea sp. NBC_01738]|uniref:Rieske (2Fe-2S) protein n=1 Tax=Nonomuraea sp. NBC_01738 TaxID=2976003 RepID=UPI002E13A882|nr:Rieske (2Fe-2S) protein [Nonomuraea sp. NBC_01738]
MAETTRRAVVLGAGGAGLAAVLTACSGYGQQPAADDAPAADQPASEAPKSGKKAGGGSKGKTLTATADIPNGGGKVFEGQKIVVTQPSEGEFKAFSAICTHQGCTVATVSGGTINCPCHGSKYNISDGSVAKGPATQGLAKKKISVDGDEIRLA